MATLTRVLAKTSYAQLAECTGVSTSAISLIMRGKRYPSLPLAAAISDALCCSLDDLRQYIDKTVGVPMTILYGPKSSGKTAGVAALMAMAGMNKHKRGQVNMHEPKAKIKTKKSTNPWTGREDKASSIARPRTTQVPPR